MFGAIIRKRYPILVLFFLAILSTVYLYTKLDTSSGINSPSKQISFPPPAVKTLPEVSPFSLSQISLLDKDSLFALDKSFALVKYTSDSPQTIFSRPIRTFIQQAGIIALVEKNNPDQITLIDYSGKTKSVFSSPDIKNVSSLTFSPDAQNIFFISNYDIRNNQSYLYVTRTDSFSPRLITATGASRVEYISENLLLMYQLVDFADSSYVSVYDYVTGATLVREKGNSYSLSPSKSLLAVQSSSSIKIIGISSRQAKIITGYAGELIAWKDSRTLISLVNKPPSVSLSFIDMESSLRSSPITLDLPNYTYLTRILASDSQRLLVVDKEGVIWSVSF